MAPPPTPINLDAIPRELRELPRWVVWRWIVREGKRTKPPFDPATGRPGDATDPRLWMSLDDAIAALPGYDGLGFAVGDTPFTGIDLDGCLDEAGTLAPWAESIVRRLDSYTERTPSGRGLRIWVRGKLPPGRRRKGPVEMYDATRYFTVTGNPFEGSPTAIADRAAELAALHAEVFPAAELPTAPTAPPVRLPIDLSDDEVLAKAFAARNGPELAALWQGDTSSFAGDDSAADLALCSKLAFWFGGDVVAIDSAFRRSGLYRAKWERADYRERTLAKAVERDTFYAPGGNGHHNGNGNGRHSGNGRRGNRGRDGGEGDPVGAAHQDPMSPNEAPDDPNRLARVCRDENFTHPAGGVTLRAWQGEWVRWDGAYRAVTERDLNAELAGAIKTEFDRLNLIEMEAWAADGKVDKKGRPSPRPTVRKVTNNLIGNVNTALRSYVTLNARIAPPAWLDGDGPFPAHEVLPARNTLVHLPSLVKNKVATVLPSPRFFCPYVLDYDFDPSGPVPLEWLKFLNGLWPEDPESIESLQEWMGYLLTPDTSQQKILMVIGPKRSGKGTIGRVIRRMIGDGNVANPTLSNLGGPFGAAPLIGKPAAIITDARISGRADSQVIVERLLSISGEDAQTIDRKYVASWMGTLPTRFTIISNELPRLTDQSGALASRMIVLRLTKTFFGNEDLALTSRLFGEIPGILLWAIEGWRRLRNRGRFKQPASAREMADDMENLASPVGAFLKDRCIVESGHEIMIADLYSAWKEWCAEKGKTHAGDEQGFGRNLRTVCPELGTEYRRMASGTRKRYYLGIALASPF